MVDSLKERVEVITDYIKFCISATIPVKSIKKHWITPHIIHSMRERWKAFKEQDWDFLKSITKQIRDYIFNAKLRYKEKLELEFSTMNTKQAFQKVRTLTGQNRKTMSPARNNPVTFIENLNTFYTRIYTEDCRALLETISPPLSRTPSPLLCGRRAPADDLVHTREGSKGVGHQGVCSRTHVHMMLNSAHLFQAPPHRFQLCLQYHPASPDDQETPSPQCPTSPHPLGTQFPQRQTTIYQSWQNHLLTLHH